MPLKLGEGLLRETFATLKNCGGGERECVCYWSGLLDELDLVDQLHHPRHTATFGFYAIDEKWLTAMWLDLSKQARAIRVQVHTHGGRAFHSALDDGFPIVTTAGFMSLVLPRFATGPVSLDDAYLARLNGTGVWEQLAPDRELEVGP